MPSVEDGKLKNLKVNPVLSLFWFVSVIQFVHDSPVISDSARPNHSNGLMQCLSAIWINKQQKPELNSLSLVGGTDSVHTHQLLFVLCAYLTRHLGSGEYYVM